MVIGREKVTVYSDRKAALSEIIAATMPKANARWQASLVNELLKLSTIKRHEWLTSRKDYILDHVAKYTYLNAF